MFTESISFTLTTQYYYIKPRITESSSRITIFEFKKKMGQKNTELTRQKREEIPIRDEREKRIDKEEARSK